MSSDDVAEREVGWLTFVSFTLLRKDQGCFPGRPSPSTSLPVSLFSSPAKLSKSLYLLQTSHVRTGVEMRTL
jgi:hypothetical protein